MSESLQENQPRELVQVITGLADSPFAARGMYNDRLHVFCHAKAEAADAGNMWNVRVLKTEDVPNGVDRYIVSLSRAKEFHQLEYNSRDPVSPNLLPDYDEAGLCAVLQRAVIDEDLSRRYQQQVAGILRHLKLKPNPGLSA